MIRAHNGRNRLAQGLVARLFESCEPSDSHGLFARALLLSQLSIAMCSSIAINQIPLLLDILYRHTLSSSIIIYILQVYPLQTVQPTRIETQVLRFSVRNSRQASQLPVQIYTCLAKSIETSQSLDDWQSNWRYDVLFACLTTPTPMWQNGFSADIQVRSFLSSSGRLP